MGDVLEVDYVVCPECGSHIEIDDVTRERFDEMFDDIGVDGRWVCFTCDWWECEADFDAWVRRSPMCGLYDSMLSWYMHAYLQSLKTGDSSWMDRRLPWCGQPDGAGDQA